MSDACDFDRHDECDSSACRCICHMKREREGKPDSEPKPTQRLAELLRDVPIQVGLRQQGHIPTVERMLDEGKSWDEIGKAINWEGATAKEWYAVERVQPEPVPPMSEKDIRADERRKTIAVLASAMKKFRPDLTKQLCEEWRVATGEELLEVLRKESD